MFRLQHPLVHEHTKRHTVIKIYHCIDSEVLLKLVKLSLEKMRSIVVWLLLLSVFVAVVSIAVNGDSNCNGAIKSLEATLVATLVKKFEQLKAEIKGSCCHGDTAGNSFLVLFSFLVFGITSTYFVVFFLVQVSRILRVKKFTRITSE